MIVLTADMHLQHENVLQFENRPFASIEEHDDVLLDNLNRMAGPKDSIIMCGDFAWRGEESLIARIRCKNVFFIVGNHDKAKVGKAFKYAADTAIIKLRGQSCFFSHYPHCYWPGSPRGAFHGYGHEHAGKEVILDSIWPQRRAMDVGVDNAFRLLGEYRPFTEDEFLDILSSRTGHDPSRINGDYHV
jgi:calcineurin-like phosphoesterase family protein